MQSTSARLQDSSDHSAAPSELKQVQIVATRSDHRAANDDETAESPEDRPNPLWAVNGAMAVFFFFAPMYLASR